MTDLAYALGDIFQWTFGILEAIGNGANYLFIVVIMAGLGMWISAQSKYLKEDRAADRLI